MEVTKTTTYSPEPRGTIVSQVPVVGTPATPGGTIEIVVAKWARIPRLTGLSRQDARATLRDRKLVVGRVREVASTKPQGTVLSQSKAIGRVVAPGTKVNLKVVDPHVCGAPLNPWCFSVNVGGSIIYRAPADLCLYINCITTFWSSTDGYVIQCGDGAFSHSGGVSGSCSSHGGNRRPLYRPAGPRESTVRFPHTWCSPSGDYCVSVKKVDGVRRLRLGMLAEYYREHEVCVRGPEDVRTCHAYRTRRFGELWGSSVDWRKHYPFQGPGIYRVEWRTEFGRLTSLKFQT
jgi:hypothetical protein